MPPCKQLHHSNLKFVTNLLANPMRLLGKRLFVYVVESLFWTTKSFPKETINFIRKIAFVAKSSFQKRTKKENFLNCFQTIIKI